jgi:hypothetical protein
MSHLASNNSHSFKRSFNRMNYELCFRASATADRKQMTQTGALSAKIIPVVVVPKSGVPDESSNTQPTAAIAATQEPARKMPLLGVMIIITPPASLLESRIHASSTLESTRVDY